jgi:hypothetical protein
MVASHDPLDQQHLAIMVESIEGPDNMTHDVIRLAINDIIRSMMPRYALQRVRR